MPATKVYFENATGRPIWLRLNAEDGELKIDVYGQEFSGVERIEPGRTLICAVNRLIRSCIRNGKLEYEFRVFAVPREKMFELSPGRERMVDGPIFRFEPLAH